MSYFRGFFFFAGSSNILVSFVTSSASKSTANKRKRKRESKISQDLARNEAFWAPLMEKEGRIAEMIRLIIEAKLRYIIGMPDSPHNEKGVFSFGYENQTLRQATHAYHHLYCGDTDRIRVQHTGNKSLSGRSGLIIRYIPSTVKKEGAYLVRLNTKNHPIAERFEGEKALICPRNLEPQHGRRHKVTDLPETFPIVILYRSESGAMKHVSFTLEKYFINAVSESLDGGTPKRCLIEPFVISTESLPPSPPTTILGQNEQIKQREVPHQHLPVTKEFKVPTPLPPQPITPTE